MPVVTAPPPTLTVPLQLPDGREASLEGDPRDLSVFGAVRAGHGQWEPHVGALFRRLVQPGWTCLDVGANIGAHTLGLASLCTQGRVVAFEAGARNAELLRRNVDRLPAPHAAVQVERVALWDEVASLHLAFTDALAGCAFLSERDEHDSEAVLRAVVAPEAVEGTDLAVTSDAVSALPLDDWVVAAGLRRVDLVKIDVEGAETRVLAGARRVLEEHRPLLVTEYNPSCAQEYWGQGPQDYYELLRDLFAAVRVVEPDGGVSAPVTQWSDLERRLREGKGWEDLLCEPRPAPRRGWRARLGRR